MKPSDLAIAKRFLAAILVLFVNLCSASLFAQDTDSALPGAGYLLAPEDILEISVWKEEGLQREVVVRPDGRLSFPLVGHIQAAGNTPEQVQQEIAKRLVSFISDPVVTVSVLRVGGNKIYVIGKVARPGEYVVGRYVDVLQALSLAGGLTPFAAENDIRILRRQNGKQVVFPFKYSEVADGEELQQNIILMSGDVVVVQ